MQKKVVQVKAVSFNLNTLKLFYLFLANLFLKYNFQFKLIFFKQKNKKITLLKSPHVHKKAREQFEITRFSYLITFTIPKAKMAEIFYLLKLNTPKNMDLNFLIHSTPV